MSLFVAIYLIAKQAFTEVEPLEEPMEVSRSRLNFGFFQDCPIHSLGSSECPFGNREDRVILPTGEQGKSGIRG